MTVELLIQEISIHVPRAGYDTVYGDVQSTTEVFLSTYPVRGTTASPSSFFHAISFLSTYPVRGTTWMASRRGFSTLYFYPRTPCGVRLSRAVCGWSRTVFLSTYPVRGTTTFQNGRKP